jgi:hypothetical protein
VVLVRYLRSKRTPYVAPVAVLAVVGLVALVPGLSGASLPAGLPAQSAQQLVADIVAAKPPQLSGALQWTVNLGFSGLSALEQETGQGQRGTGSGAGSFDPLTLLSDDYQVNVWLDGTTAEHLALVDGPAEEVDLVRNRDQAWLWDSSTQTVTHFIWAESRGQVPTGSGLPPIWAPPTPEQLAAGLLSDLGRTTAVTVGDPLYVAGEPAYQLLVTPNAAPGSTVDHIEIDVGASGSLLGVPLQVAVYATGQASPAIELGFTGVVHLGPPPASELTFTPPPGSKVTTRTLGDGHGGHGGRAGGGLSGTTVVPSALGLNPKDVTTTGTGWATVLSGSAPGLFSSAGDGPASAATTVVQVSGQRARLFSTVLLNVLLMPDGRFYAGLVTPSVLEAAASATS